MDGAQPLSHLTAEKNCSRAPRNQAAAWRRRRSPQGRAALLTAASTKEGHVAIGIVGDYDPGYFLHAATDAAFARLGAQAAWVPTPAVYHDPSLLGQFHGLLIPPGSPYKSMDGALGAIRYARENEVPLLGTCSGFQHVLVEFARNAAGIHGAALPALDPGAEEFICAPLACSATGEEHPVSIAPGTLAASLYRASETTEPFYCTYGLNTAYKDRLEESGMRFSGSDADGVARILEIPSHPFFLATLYVPQARQTDNDPHPVLAGLVSASENRS
jgi:CTP synthase (UTP-ammonia lyase)